MSIYDQEPKPLIEQLIPGRHAICACGETKRPPYCDGSHSGTGITPQILDIGETGQTIAWCTCNASGNKPMCDGSHKEQWEHKPPPKE